MIKWIPDNLSPIALLDVARRRAMCEDHRSMNVA
jgi:hypothetical protein